ncbi:hypothetical protein BLOT_013117, partial [Blomia tropicalis]
MKMVKCVHFEPCSLAVCVMLIGYTENGIPLTVGHVRDSTFSLNSVVVTGIELIFSIEFKANQNATQDSQLFKELHS